ncbi:MAG: polysaccharide biosynthesis/export family protein [Duncaniella sp.]|nr:polysaccharide biosynthesis/export family protein [Duncaniella sp.]MDE6581834.1 polysaccharide biosynthesis/export family protein [Duncaniella sp.]
MKLHSVLASLIFLLAMSACSSHKTALPYFKDLPGTAGTLESFSYIPTVQPDDELFISVSAFNMNAVAAYQTPLSNPATREDVLRPSSPQFLTYIVDSKGDIEFPVLGKIHVEGLTTEQVAQELTNLISKEVQDPIVRVELINFKVIVAGEVAKPAIVKVPNSRMTILEAISEAGDLTPYGRRDNVLVIREENGKRTYARVDLSSKDLLNSPYYYLKQNDYIYIEPNQVREANARYNQDNAYKLQVTSTVVSAASVIASLVIALTVK